MDEDQFSHSSFDIQSTFDEDQMSNCSFSTNPQIDYDHAQSDHAIIINTDPVLNIDPDPPIIPLRRSERIASRNKNKIESPILPELKSIPFTDRCHIKHIKENIGCADLRARHFSIDYYDSGNLGDAICGYCEAELFRSEVNIQHLKKTGIISSSSCCQCGSIILPPYKQHPKYLVDLSKGVTPESKEFLRNQNVYNSLLAFASISVGHQDSSMYGHVSYLLNGEFKRQISSMFPGDNAPSFSQLYILDPNTALDYRKQNPIYGGDRINNLTLKKLDKILRDIHPFAKIYQNFHQQYQQKLAQDGPDSVKNFRLTLIEARNAPNIVNDHSLHPRAVNLPEDRDSLFAVWTETGEPLVCHGIWITDAQGKLSEIRPYHPLTDTLCYPLLFPNGDDGYHKNIPKKTFLKSITNDNESSDNDEMLSPIS
jgi:hypothetical protein